MPVPGSAGPGYRSPPPGRAAPVPFPRRGLYAACAQARACARTRVHARIPRREDASQMTVRRTPKAAARAGFWVEQLAGTTDGGQALADAWRWVRKELAVVAEQRPEAAEA